MPKVILEGKASGKVLLEEIVQGSDESLLNFLRDKGQPIASSCDGEGICRNCVCNDGSELLCQMYLDEYDEQEEIKIQVDYL